MMMYQMKRTIAVLKIEMNFRGAIDMVSRARMPVSLMLLLHHLVELAAAVTRYLRVIPVDTRFRSKIGKIRVIAQVRHSKMKYGR